MIVYQIVRDDNQPVLVMNRWRRSADQPLWKPLAFGTQQAAEFAVADFNRNSHAGPHTIVKVTL